MTTADVKTASEDLPTGYFAIPVMPEQAAAPLRICALLSKEADKLAGQLVVLRESIDARVFLGCILDAHERVQRWIEIQVQRVDGFVTQVSAYRESLSNKSLDERWCRAFEGIRQARQSNVINVGWETEHPLPVYLDPESSRPVNPVEPETGKPWELCCDDALLIEAGLPAYSSSLYRYLYVREMGDASPFVPTSQDAPTSERTRPMEVITRATEGLAPLNPTGGLMLVREHHAIAFEAFADVLGGEAWDGISHGRSFVLPGTAAQKLAEREETPSTNGRLFLDGRGKWGRLTEAFHLKLRLLADLAEAIQSTIRHNRRPLLNLTPDSIQVRLAEPAGGLPFLWTATPILTDAGDAVDLPIEGTDATYYVRPGMATASVYWPEAAGPPVRGRGEVRIRKVSVQDDNETVIEGTLATRERIETAHYDLIWLRLSVAGSHIDLYANLERGAALAAGDWRFRTISRRLTNDQAEAIKSAEGVLIRYTPFEVIPLLSSPCDLYAFCVMAGRTLLVDNESTLAAALDDIRALARQVAADFDEDIPLPQRVKKDSTATPGGSNHWDRTT